MNSRFRDASLFYRGMNTGRYNGTRLEFNFERIQGEERSLIVSTAVFFSRSLGRVRSEILSNYRSSKIILFGRTGVKKRKSWNDRGYEKWNSGEIIASRYDTRVDFTDDGARRFALTRARNEITPGIEIPARNQSETILDFNPRVTNEPIIT